MKNYEIKMVASTLRFCPASINILNQHTHTQVRILVVQVTGQGGQRPPPSYVLTYRGQTALAGGGCVASLRFTRYGICRKITSAFRTANTYVHRAIYIYIQRLEHPYDHIRIHLISALPQTTASNEQLP